MSIADLKKRLDTSLGEMSRRLDAAEDTPRGIVAGGRYEIEVTYNDGGKQTNHRDTPANWMQPRKWHSSVSSVTIRDTQKGTTKVLTRNS